ncbi:hypothetical protein ACFLXG_03120 [Chloroflexota bacterium]
MNNMNSNSSITEHPSVKEHVQKYGLSCIPSAVEMILKWLGIVGENYYELQHEWDDKKGTFANFDGETINGVKFKGKFINYKLKCPTFPYDKLFEAIDKELAQCKCVLVMLPNPKNQKHIYIIYDNENGDYKAFTKYIIENKEIIYFKNSVRDCIEWMGGNHLLTYELQSIL